MRDLKMRTKTDDQGMIGIKNDDEVKTVCLNTAVVDTAICQVIEQGEFLSYKSGALQKEVGKRALGRFFAILQYFLWIIIAFLSQNLGLTLTYSLCNPLSHLKIIHVDMYAYPPFDGVCAILTEGSGIFLF